ncbi:MAG: YwiC-like family protein [Actinomycetaceae bacterium]|nr:YwiC-like family protein [Actinomycetaceae bacterium]
MASQSRATSSSSAQRSSALRTHTSRARGGGRGKSGSTRSLMKNGWIPDQHGAWPMAIIPAILGATLGGWQPIHGLLIASWLSGFLFFNAVELYAKSSRRRRPRLYPALGTWLIISCLLGYFLLSQAPYLLVWIPFFAPLVAVAFIEVFRGNERSLVSRTVTILASTLMTPVAFTLSFWWHNFAASIFLPMPGAIDHIFSSPDWIGNWLYIMGFLPQMQPLWAKVWVTTGVLAAYFLGTVPLVRSLIRGRSNMRWVWGSVLWYMLTGVGVTFGAMDGFIHWALIAVWGGLSIRGAAMPWWQRTHKPFKPIQIGLAEMAWCGIIAALLTT